MEIINETHALLKEMTPEEFWKRLSSVQDETEQLLDSVELWFKGLLAADAFLTTMCREGKLTEQVDLDTLIRFANTVVRVARLPDDQVNGARCLVDVLEVMANEGLFPEEPTLRQIWDLICERIIISDKQIKENEQRT